MNSGGVHSTGVITWHDHPDKLIMTSTGHAEIGIMYKRFVLLYIQITPNAFSIP